MRQRFTVDPGVVGIINSAGTAVDDVCKDSALSRRLQNEGRNRSKTKKKQEDADDWLCFHQCFLAVTAISARSCSGHVLLHSTVALPKLSVQCAEKQMTKDKKLQSKSKLILFSASFLLLQNESDD